MSESDSDDVPLAQRVPQPKPAPRAAPAADAAGKKRKAAPSTGAAAKRPKAPAAAKPRGGGGAGPSEPADSGDESSDDEEDDEEDDDGEKPGGAASRAAKRAAKDRKAVAQMTRVKKGAKKVWETLEHCGVTFPPPYEPHGVKLLYDGRPVDLSPEEEEVATFFAVMKDTDYAAKKVFVENFWKGFRRVLKGANRELITTFSKCDFTNIYNWHVEERDKKKLLTSEQKKAAKAERDAAELKYTTATMDGRVEKVGNFRVEPPGLFRGRGEHPKMGMIKRRIQAEDIIINIGKDATPPAPPAGHSWKAVIHNQYVSWLAGWKDSINTKDWKYVQLGATSTIKGESDQRKYEKARELKKHIDSIRADYKQNMKSKDASVAQLAVTTYLVDKLALRAGGEKDEDLADTVGVCTLRVGHVQRIPPCTLKFDFLGKDSIRYLQEHEVMPEVYDAIGKFAVGKKPDEDLFDLIDPTKVNKHLQQLMPGLTIKVFRTYNASITLSRLLKTTDRSSDVAGKKAQYDEANKEVAILCNHQKGVSKNHDAAMAKLNEKKQALQAELEEAKGAAAGRIRERLATLERTMESRESLKNVSLGTSKINYLDPRISVAWCKQMEVPIEKIYTKVLLEKFGWSMEVEPTFDF